MLCSSHARRACPALSYFLYVVPQDSIYDEDSSNEEDSSDNPQHHDSPITKYESLVALYDRRTLDGSKFVDVDSEDNVCSSSTFAHTPWRAQCALRH